MKSYRSPDGEQRLWFDDGEIENIAEDELRRASLYPTTESPVVDVERLLERHLRADLDLAAALESEVLGMTVFAPGSKPRVSINRDLTSSALDDDDVASGQLGRWRATLAHEAAHIMLHRILFEFPEADQGSLFEPTSQPSSGRALQRCLKRDVGFIRVSDWREVQANRGMAALLMPKRVFLRLAEDVLIELGTSSGVARGDSPEERNAASELAEKFEVSRQAATIRLRTLGCVADHGDTLDLTL